MKVIDDVKCSCCGLTMAAFRGRYPIRVKVVKANPYGLPHGKMFFARRKEGDGSPFVIEARGAWPAFFHGRTYQFRGDEIEVAE